MTTLDSLSRDILCDILSRLPIKTLVFLSCLCKLFQDLITNDQALIYTHLKRSATRLSDAIICSKESLSVTKGPSQAEADVLEKFKNTSFSKSPFHLGENYVLAGSCNGVLCFYERYVGSQENRIYVWNPALHQIKALSKLIGFDDFIGFGYDVTNQDYKILRIDRKCNKAEVFSLKNDRWKLVRRNFEYVPQHYGDKHIVDFQGCLHWVSRVNRPNRDIIAFNISDERIQKYTVPGHMPGTMCYMLGVFKGCVSVLIERVKCKAWEIWSIQKSGEDSFWLKTYEFTHTSPWYSFFQGIRPLGLTMTGKIIVFERKRHILFNPETDCLQEFRLEFDSPRNPYHTRRFKLFVSNYVASLVSIHPRPDVIVSSST